MLLRRFAIAWSLLFLCAMAFSGAARSDSDAAASERRIKAAFLYKFAEYVEWPPEVFSDHDTPLTIAVIGDDQFASELTLSVAGRRLEGRGFEVRRVRANDKITDVHVLFISRGSSGALQREVVQPHQPVLVVTEAVGALQQGATINFLVKDARVRFEVSLEDAERRSLKLSSRLLTVAQNTRRGAE